MEKFKNAVLYILIIVLVIMNYMTLDRVENLEHNIWQVNSSVNNVRNEINGINYNISEQLKEDDPVQHFEYDVTEKTGDLVTVDVKVEMNKLYKNSRVFLVYEEEDAFEKYYGTKIITGVEASGIIEKVELSHDGNMNFFGSFEANKKLIYSIDILIESEDYSESVAMSGIELFYRYYGEPDIELNRMRMSHSNGEGVIEYEARIHYFEQEDVTLSEAICTLEYDGQVIDTFDLLKEGHKDTFEMEKLTFYDMTRTVKVKEDNPERFYSDLLKLTMTVKNSDGIIYIRDAEFY